MDGLKVESLHYLNKGPIRFSVAGGKTLGVVGPSGSGKTLLLRALADLDPHEGQVSLNGVSSHAMPAPLWRRKVGLLPAENQWWFETVGSHFSEIEANWLEALGFEEDVLKWEITRLSTGEKRRLALIRLLGNQPEAMLLDEPTANLDRVNTTRVEDLIEKYQKRNRTAVVWVSHSEEQRRRVADTSFDVVSQRLLEELA